MEKGTNFLHEFIAGNVGGLLGITLVYPLDTAKIRMQVFPQYTSTLNVISSMSKNDGFKSLYRGISFPAMGFGLTFAISFSCYGQGCSMISQYKRKDVSALGYLELSLAGAYTGVMQSPARQLVERVKSVMQIREAQGGKTPYSWSGPCLVDLVRKEGLRNGVFQGYSSVLIREVPQFAVYYPSYEFCKTLFDQHLESKLLVQFLAGGSAGVIQWLPPFYCADVIKSRMQTASMGYYSSVADCVAQLYREGGLRIFVRGLSPAMFRAAPLHATIFVGYESVMKYFRTRNIAINSSLQ